MSITFTRHICLPTATPRVRSGPSKKLAKNAAAKAALAALCDISYSPMQALPASDAYSTNDKKESFELPQTFADAIGKYVDLVQFGGEEI